ncbi:uncharacterized protein APUU_40681A [Aspergillus puulaauensis]|uniref:Uncharacterized protein n=1 Tax=Aspergillus puulaauensis TaxID=1220207 RepID=A0A7R8AMW0_9EURO|nr:uncharacterized protein APUU_40681A [Aspergillus puulaauensis]BCS24237.1 hypothetical protein APUU_40681A [Aspergillus puulaauensis]
MEPEPSTHLHAKSDSRCEGVILALSDAASASEDETTATSYDDLPSAKACLRLGAFVGCKRNPARQEMVRFTGP